MKPVISCTLLAALVALGSCATPPAPLGRDKPGATMEAFMSDRYACLQESSGRVSSATVNANGGQSSSAISCNYQLYDACMNAKGYYVVQYGRFQAPVTCAR
jgi:hypothetical protein